MTGSCLQPRRWRLALSAMLDGEATLQTRRDAEAHLDRCPECAAWYLQARAMSRQLSARSPEIPDLSRRVIGVVEAHICGCHRGAACECTDCQCIGCTCGRGAGS